MMTTKRSYLSDHLKITITPDNIKREGKREVVAAEDATENWPTELQSFVPQKIQRTALLHTTVSRTEENLGVFHPIGLTPLLLLLK